MIMDNLDDHPFDLTGEDDVLGGRRDDRDPKHSAIPRLRQRVDRLCICRESTEFDAVLMRGMVQQTLAFMPDTPGVRLAKDLEIDPMTPEFHRPGVKLLAIRQGSASAVLFEIAGDFFLYSMTSAAKSNAYGENDWTTICVDVLRALRPVDLYVASVSRLVRSFEHTGTLLTAVSKWVDTVRAGHAVMSMRGPQREMGHMMWAMLATVAASERNLIVQRLTAGVVAKYRRGEWIKGKGTVPLGYRLDPTRKTLIVDPGQTEAVRVAFTLMADPNFKNHQIVHRLGALGVTSVQGNRLHGKGSTVADLDPGNYLRALRRWSHLYLTGTHTVRWRNPFEGAPHIAGMPVHPTGDGVGELRFAYEFGRPEIDPAIVQAAADAQVARRRNPVTGGAAHAQISPLNGLSWIQDGVEYWLASEREGYNLRARGAVDI